MATDAAVTRRWKTRLRARLALQAHSRKQVSYWAKKKAKARNATSRAHARDMLAKREATLKLRNQQVADARAVLKRHAPKGSGADAAVKWALAQVGTAEHPAGSNWGPKISDWIKASGYGSGVPWCQAFANAAAVHGGAPQLRTGYTPTVLAGIGGYKRIPASQARRGDFVFFKWPGVSSATCDHVAVLTGPPRNGLAPTCEGNTSATNSGSQNNGGQVAVRSRPTAYVAGYVRPPYPS